MSRGWKKLIERVGAKPFRPRHSTATGRRTPAWEHAELIDEPVRSRSTGYGYRIQDCFATMIDRKQPGVSYQPPPTRALPAPPSADPYRAAGAFGSF